MRGTDHELRLGYARLGYARLEPGNDEPRIPRQTVSADFLADRDQGMAEAGTTCSESQSTGSRTSGHVMQ